MSLSYSILDNNGLKQCSLINSDFLPAAQRLLFGTISIRTQKELNNILSILEFSPHIAAYITALSIEGCDLFHLGARMDTIVAFLWLLPSLDDLHLNRHNRRLVLISPHFVQKLRIEGIAQFPETNCDAIIHLDQFPCLETLQVHWSGVEFLGYVPEPALRWTISHLAIRGPHPLQKFILEGAAESAWFQIDASVWKMLDDLLMQDYFTALSTVELRAEYYIVVDDSGLEDSISCFRHWKDTTPLPRFQARSNATLALMVRERRRRKRISLSPLFVV
ncbi:hypothetical protein DL96DRAFT_1590473 [Flagelloscypha sp. PMI_526]|nr:hypothetical protein DL96DRAFT_1590473 [Flagelloscypha sp. PMI_526]